MMDRSYYELAMSPLEKVGFMFASDQRKSTATLIAAFQLYKAGKITAGGATRVFAVQWLAAGMGSALIAAALRDWHDKRDDEWLDWEHWNPVGLFKDTLLGPLGGIPLLNALVSFDGKVPFGILVRAGEAALQLAKGHQSNPGKLGAEQPVSQTVNQVATVAKGAAMVIPGGEFVAVSATVLKELFSTIYNFVPDTAEEAVKKQKKTQAREQRSQIQRK